MQGHRGRQCRGAGFSRFGRLSAGTGGSWGRVGAVSGGCGSCVGPGKAVVAGGWGSSLADSGGGRGARSHRGTEVIGTGCGVLVLCFPVRLLPAGLPSL